MNIADSIANGVNLGKVFEFVCPDAMFAKNSLQEGIRSGLFLSRDGRIAAAVKVGRICVGSIVVFRLLVLVFGHSD